MTVGSSSFGSRQHRSHSHLDLKSEEQKEIRSTSFETPRKTDSLIEWTLENFSCTSGRFCASQDDHFIYDDPKDSVTCWAPTTASNSAVGSQIIEDVDSGEDLPTNSLYRRTMTTAALANEGGKEDTNSSNSNNSGTSNNATNAAQTNAQEQLKKTAALARGLADDASRAIGNLLPTASLQNITTRKYTLPDKTVASQVLMYRQLLHTSCRPGLKLSRPYQATPAQKAVMHMPWWEEGIEDSKKMIISYNNLIKRLWLNGAIEPYAADGQTDEPGTTSKAVDTFMTDEGLPPIPHTYWVERLGFQQPDPVTDFRSGGVLSLAMMVYMVESRPEICKRFFFGDAAVLPFGITCINITDMIAKFLMLAKSTDRMDALLSQKPFWRMFADPNAILAVQELAMTMLCDVVVEIAKEKQIPILAKQYADQNGGSGGDKVSIFFFLANGRTSKANTTVASIGQVVLILFFFVFYEKVTVFDFSTILERSERRVRDDLLGAGPKTVDELRSIAGRLQVKYKNQLERKIQRAQQQQEQEDNNPGGAGIGGGGAPPQIKDVMDKATNMAGGLFAKMKNQQFPNFSRRDDQKSPASASTSTSNEQQKATVVDLPPTEPSTTAATAAGTKAAPDTSSASANAVDSDWVGTDMTPAMDAISNFSIGDDDEDDDIL